MKRRWIIAGATCIALIYAGVLVRTVRRNRQLAKRAAAYRIRAEQGDPKSQWALGSMYYYGKGVPQDFTEAARWYRKSADQGYPRGQYDLGYMYYYGYGVPQDRVKAHNLFWEAAAHGDDYARRSLQPSIDPGAGLGWLQ